MRSTALLMTAVTSEARATAAAVVLAMTAVKTMAVATAEARAAAANIATVRATMLTIAAAVATAMTW